MKKIYLQITPFFPTNESFRGPYVYDQVKAIQDNSDFEVIVIKPISIFDKSEDESYLYQGIKVYNFVVYDLPSSVLPGIFQKLNLVRLEKFIKNKINIKISDVKYIHTHVIYPAGMLGVEFGKKYNIKNFIQHHGFDVFQEENGRILKGKLRNLNKSFMYKNFIKLVNNTDLNIGVSQKVIDVLKSIKGYNNKNNYVLYNGVSTEKFYKIDNLKDEKVFTIGCIGNFWELKDHMTLLRALKIVVETGEKNILVKFIGSGPTLTCCKEYIHLNKLEKYVSFSKELDHTELNKFYNSLNLFVLPSYYEAFGCVYSEALQVGTPIIAVENQGIEEIIFEEDKNKMLIKKGDFSQLTNLIKLYKNNEVNIKDYDLNINNFVKDFLKNIKRLGNE